MRIVLNEVLWKTWTFGKSVYDQRASIGSALIAAGTTMLSFDWHKETAIPLIVVGTVLAAQGKPLIQEKPLDES